MKPGFMVLLLANMFSSYYNVLHYHSKFQKKGTGCTPLRCFVMLIRQNFAEKKCVLSIEVFPPKTEPGWKKLQHLLQEVKAMNPAFVSVTCSAGGSGTTGIPTSEVASFVKNEIGIEPLAHVTCVGNSEEELNQNLQHLFACGIRNIMCLRGDINPDLPLNQDFLHASDMAAYIQKHYGCFGLSGGCYPEHHPESATLLEDVRNLKRKQDAGVSHLVSQLFFDNAFYYRFAHLARKEGVTAPISIGVMPIAKKVHIKNVVQLSGATVPPRFAALLDKWQDDPDGLFKAGTDYAIEQCRDLIEGGVDGIHIYAMNNLDVTTRVYEGIRDLL